MTEALEVNKDEKYVSTPDGKFPFDYLIIATGSKHSYFGKEEWEQYAPGLKTLGDALQIRERILNSLEEAEKISDPGERKKYLNFVIVGGGPTGVEMAGAIAEIINATIIKDYKRIGAGQAKVYLVEAVPRILSMYPEELSGRAVKDLNKLGVEVHLNTRVTNIDAGGVDLGDTRIESVNVIWAAGNSASKLIRSLNIETDKAGRAVVNPDLSIPGCPDIFVIGDAAVLKDSSGNILPGVAPVAIQQGKYTAEIIRKQVPPGKRKPFHYRDKGNLATIGRAKAVADIHGFKLAGFIAWLTWSFVHIFFLIGFRNRIRVMAEWIWYYITYRHGIRLITGNPEVQREKKAHLMQNTNI